MDATAAAGDQPVPAQALADAPSGVPAAREERDILAGSSFILHGATQVAASLASLAMEDAAKDIVARAQAVIAEIRALHPEDEKMEKAGVVQGKVEKGETLGEILENAATGSVNHYVNAAARVFPLRSFRAGQPYTVFTDPKTGQVHRFEYEVNDQRRLVVEGLEKPLARLEEIEYSTYLAVCEGEVEESLFQAVADIGESPQLALKLVDLFGSEINFVRDIREGDTFSLLIEKRFREGEYRGYGKVIAARFTNRGKTFEAWLFRDETGNLQHYNANGENLKKTLLMAPLAVTRLTSRFTHARKHPILGVTRAHLGVDYGAPTGTPVKAVGDGIVEKRGWAGGYGNQIILKHGAGLESYYGHLSGFARGLKQGQRVRQGQVIGFVGSTGLSTGPHLDFRLRHKGTFINPVKAINPRGAPVSPGMMAAFRKSRDLQRAYLEGAKLPRHYALANIVPNLTPARAADKADASKSGKLKQRRVKNRGPSALDKMNRRAALIKKMKARYRAKARNRGRSG